MPTEEEVQANTVKKPVGKKILVVFVIFLFVAIVIGAWYVVNPSGSDSGDLEVVPKTDDTQSVEVKSDSDLKKLEEEVKNTNVNDLSNDLKGNDKDASDF